MKPINASHRAAMEHYRKACDRERELLAREPVNPWRVLAGVICGMLFLALVVGLMDGVFA